MFGWRRGPSRREAALQAELDSKCAELSAVKAAASDLLVSPGNGSFHFGRSEEFAKAKEQLAAYHSWTFVATKAIATRLSAQPIALSRVLRRSTVRGVKQATPTNSEPIDQHPLLDLLHDPCPLGTRWTFMYATAAGILLSGRGFWWLTKGPELYWLPSSWIEGYVGYSRYEGWRVRVPGSTEAFTVPADEMTYFHLPDPANPHGAVSPLKAAGAAVCADDEILKSQTAGFRNGIFPRMAFVLAKGATADGKPSPATVLTSAQRRQLIEAGRAMWAGTLKSQDPMIIGDGLLENIIKLTSSPHEMDWMESGKTTKARILQAFSVNPISVGEIESANRSSSVEAERHLCMNAVNPLAVMMSEAMTEWLCPMFATEGERLVLTIEPAHPRDEELELRRLDMLARYGCLEINEARVACGFPAVSWGDAPISPANGISDGLSSMVDDALAKVGARHTFNVDGGKANGNHQPLPSLRQ